ncbi:MAG: hypothetical protein HQ518_23520 [Rhodopirellula sp.]|nr:hypothetical protein [Rhodopirellula sp.]
MTDIDVRDLENRLETLERQNQFFKRIVVGLSVGAVAVLMVGAAAPDLAEKRGDGVFDTLRVKKVVISDSNGQERLVLGLDSNEPALEMFNHKHQRQVFLGIDELWDDTAYLSVSSRLEDGDVDKQAVLATTPSFSGLPGSSQLILFDARTPQENSGQSHLIRLSSGQADQKPYLEIHESSMKEQTEVNLKVLRARPTATGQRVLLDTNTDPATLSGARVAPVK